MYHSLYDEILRHHFVEENIECYFIPPSSSSSLLIMRLLRVYMNSYISSLFPLILIIQYYNYNIYYNTITIITITIYVYYNPLSVLTTNMWTIQHSGSANIAIGSVVLINEDNAPPLQWKLARVIDTYPGNDDIVRVVSVKTADGIYKRCVKKLCPLPVDAPHV